ncbi:helix-turn-helix domain-containing protein [Paenibacillus dendritiformis]|uniref:helix-turn-helix domain-containing protein n=1 Tax=Paenibacillus dendritiformis TaxID=130049 RepID=UPI000DA7F36D|nr:AraC family transcriptional regulator [Paenibacillus dendritiformis]PZM62160.1 AraC family transcriptional regulator [Paenibacillus dendritiformis]
MIDVEKLAEVFANDSYDIKEVYRLVIQPKSILREFRTVKYGFLFVIRGAARISVNGMVYELQSGSVLHAAPGMQMESQVAGQSELEYYSVFYRLDKIGEDNSVHECNAHFKLEPGANPRVIELLMMLHQHAHTLGGIGKLHVKELFLSILHQVLVGHRHRVSSGAPSQRVIEEAIEYMKRHYMNPLTLEEMAELHGMTPKSFSYFFHKYTGFRPIDYLINYRMERASELLKAGNFPIRDIAVSVGYANPLYFSRAFKKKFGMSPSAYAAQ